jgi:hypothetical protein
MSLVRRRPHKHIGLVRGMHMRIGRSRQRLPIARHRWVRERVRGRLPVMRRLLEVASETPTLPTVSERLRRTVDCGPLRTSSCCPPNCKQDAVCHAFGTSSRHVVTTVVELQQF